MCGIVGILKREGSPPPQEAGLRGILCMIRHCGSDQFGIYLYECVGLGHGRLSIIDLGGAGTRAIS